MPEHARPDELVEGTYFPLWDLTKAVTWAAVRSGVRLVVAADHQDIPEALEIHSPQTNSPRWCIWRDQRGILHLDDWQLSYFDQRFITLDTALAFVSSELKELAHSPRQRPGPRATDADHAA
jgi:hypothetical protein